MEIKENVNPQTERRLFSKIPLENRKNMQSQKVTCDSRDRPFSVARVGDGLVQDVVGCDERSGANSDSALLCFHSLNLRTCIRFQYLESIRVGVETSHRDPEFHISSVFALEPLTVFPGVLLLGNLKNDFSVCPSINLAVAIFKPFPADLQK